MGGDHHGDHGHHKVKIPDYTIYKVEDAPQLIKVRDALAKRGLKDPWLRNYVWQFNPEISGGSTKLARVRLQTFRGFKYGFGLFLANILFDIARANKKGPGGGDDDHCREKAAYKPKYVKPRKLVDQDSVHPESSFLGLDEESSHKYTEKRVDEHVPDVLVDGSISEKNLIDATSAMQSIEIVSDKETMTTNVEQTLLSPDENIVVETGKKSDGKDSLGAKLPPKTEEREILPPLRDENIGEEAQPEFVSKSHPEYYNSDNYPDKTNEKTDDPDKTNEKTDDSDKTNEKTDESGRPEK